MSLAATAVQLLAMQWRKPLPAPWAWILLAHPYPSGCIWQMHANNTVYQKAALILDNYFGAAAPLRRIRRGPERDGVESQWVRRAEQEGSRAKKSGSRVGRI